MHIHTKLVPWMLPISVAMMSCGTQPGSKSATEVPAISASASDSETAALLDDEQLAGEHISASVDDAISETVAGDDSSIASGLGLLASGTKVAKGSRYRTCKAGDDGKSAIVTIKRGTERSLSFSKMQRTGTSAFKDLSEEVRTWSKTDATVACDATGKHIVMARADLQGVRLRLTLNQERSRSASYKNGKTGTETSRSYSFTATGSRDVTWSKVETVGKNLVLTRTISGSSERTVKTANKKGEASSFTSSVTTATDAPLVVKIERDLTSDSLVSRTIISGKKVATNKQGGRIETTFANVKYAAGDGCYASSGSITGSVFAKDATTASATFTIDFSGDTKSIVTTTKDGVTKEIDYIADGCAIDKDDVDSTAGAVTDEASAAAVKVSDPS